MPKKQDKQTVDLEKISHGVESLGAEPQVYIPQTLTVKQLAGLLNVSPVEVIKQLMRNGIMATINQAIDRDAASVVAFDFGYRVKTEPSPELEADLKKEVPPSGRLEPRPPVITIMGHVDHGKTSLLDAIRQTNVTATEVGSITQHIGAYQVEVNERKIIFLDTPGHEAFTAMRARGAKVTDIAVLVVAADDGVMPQTVEAVNHARAAGVPIVVAINKIDKANANVEHVKHQLAELGLIIEEWGGDTVCVPISAKKRVGISDLLENLLLVADIAELKADPYCRAGGTVIEAKLDKTRGPVATVLVQKGTLVVGDVIVVGNTWGKIKAMFNDRGKRVKKAEPAIPVGILGLNAVPQAGDIFEVVTDEHQAKASLGKVKVEKEAFLALRKPLSLDDVFTQVSSGEVKELNVILKTDVQGSIEPIKTSLERLTTDKVKIKVLHSASGSITESDVLLAVASKGVIIGFNARPEPGAKRLAELEKVDIRYYDVIYDLIEDVEKALKGLLEPSYIEVVEGRAEVRAIFVSGKKGKVAGVYVFEGKISRDASARIKRQGNVIQESRVSSLRRFKEDVNEVVAGFECGVGIEGFVNFEVGDIIETYTKQKATSG